MDEERHRNRPRCRGETSGHEGSDGLGGAGAFFSNLSRTATASARNLIGMTATIIAAVAIIASLLTFALTYVQSVRAERRGRMPVLVLLPDPSGWRLENIGGGPALNILIAQGRGPAEGGGVIALRSDAIGPDGSAHNETWCNPVHLRPVAAGGSQQIPWAFSTDGVGVSFTDALGHAYTLRMSRLGSLIIEKRGIPEWRDDEWRQISDLEGDGTGVVEPWAVRRSATA
jgi:hypothetical protein